MLGTRDGPTEKKELVIMTTQRKYVNSSLLDKSVKDVQRYFQEPVSIFIQKNISH